MRLQGQCLAAFTQLLIFFIIFFPPCPPHMRASMDHRILVFINAGPICLRVFSLSSIWQHCSAFIVAFGSRQSNTPFQSKINVIIIFLLTWDRPTEEDFKNFCRNLSNTPHKVQLNVALLKTTALFDEIKKKKPSGR